MDETLVTLGVTHLVPNQLEEILYFDSPEEGDKVTRNSSFGSLESVTGWISLISPVSGPIVELNPEVLEEPYLLNDDPYGHGWIARIEIESENELTELMRAPQYKTLSFK